MSIRLLIADDHEIFRQGLKMILENYPGMEVIGEAANGKQLIEEAERLTPDVIVTDIKMPIMDGIAATRRLRQKFPEISIIALTMFDDESMIVDMLEAGAIGYLLKNVNGNEIKNAILSVYEGRSYYCPHTSAKIAKLIADSKFNPYRSKEESLFSVREIEIIRLICSQFTNKEIATKLDLSIRTVESHKQRIQDKMKVANTVGIVIYAIKNEIFPFGNFH